MGDPAVWFRWTALWQIGSRHHQGRSLRSAALRALRPLTVPPVLPIGSPTAEPHLGGSGKRKD
jgi:hypothetical protein